MMSIEFPPTIMTYELALALDQLSTGEREAFREVARIGLDGVMLSPGMAAVFVALAGEIEIRDKRDSAVYQVIFDEAVAGLEMPDMPDDDG